MNLLIIGNGLDLDLGLPTKYTDFLHFTNAFKFSIAYDEDRIDEIDEFNICDSYRAIFYRYQKPDSANSESNYQKSKSILKKFDKSFSNPFINKACKDFYYCINNNCWIKYFNERYEQNLIAGENWIDLESEIQSVIKILESKKKLDVVDEKGTSSIQPANFNLNQLDIQTIINGSGKSTLFKNDYNKFKNVLLNDFDRFIMALGIYLDFFVGQLSPYVEHASKELNDMMTNKASNKIECVLSFNYKNNFKQQNSLSKTCYIHGSINYVQELKDHVHKRMGDEDKTYMNIKEIIKRNRMIVGFDDLKNTEENLISQDVELEFIDYHKYFQRIYKGTDSQYVDWLNKYQEEIKTQKNIPTLSGETRESVVDRMILRQAETKPNQIFIFGHSLDATDNEIFRDIFLRELNDTQIVIYYHDSAARKRIITNLVRILTQQILVQKTKGTNPNIKFVPQTYIE